MGNTLDDPVHIELYKLRRFALVVGLILLAYSLAGGRVADFAQLPPLGLGLKFTRPIIFEWALALVSLYAAARSGYYLLVKSPPPWNVRKQLENGKFGPIVCGVENQGPVTTEIARRYVPGLEAECNVVKRLNDQVGYIGISGAGNYPWPTRVWILLDNLDYTAPIWVNGIALLAFIVVKVCF